jgi:TerC family integral membrane protein
LGVPRRDPRAAHGVPPVALPSAGRTHGGRVEVASIGSPALWAGFVGFVAAMLALDLGVFHRRSHAVRLREAASWSAVWIALALLFGAWVWHAFGPERGLEFLTGYLVEKSLSVDNLFVFLVVFSALGIPAAHQHRVLFWGILGALVLRAAMIFGGSALLARFHWLVYVLGVFLVATGVKLFVRRNETPHPENGVVMRVARRWIPSTPRLHGPRFVTVEDGRRVATPLLLALVLVEVTDVVFAVDSIPAILAISRDPFIVFTSNIFAILGLRSLFFLLAGAVDRFRHLKVALSAILVFVGVKMTAADVVDISPAASLAVVVSMLGAAIAASLWTSRRAGRAGGRAAQRTARSSSPG